MNGMIPRMRALMAVVMAVAVSGARPALRAEPGSPEPDPGGRAFPGLGSPADRQVEVAWNRYYDHAGLRAILERLHAAFPGLTRLYSIGRSFEGRELWCLEVTAFDKGDPGRKPGMYIDGNIHGNEVQCGEVVAYTAWYLCHQYQRLETVTDLLDHQVFYLVPTINPDGRDRWFHSAQTSGSSRSGVQPLDNDRDGLCDEDDFDDLDGDGTIAQMRIRDPAGRWKAHPEHPEFLMIEAPADQPGDFTLLGFEGLDNDGDGRINEDPAGGYDMNRNWAYDWQPNYVQSGARDYPFSLPETRAVADFMRRRSNLAAAQSYHNSGGLILRGPGREGGPMLPEDERVLIAIAHRGERFLPFYRALVTWRDLYTVWGGEKDWFYGALGILGFTNELWTRRNLFRLPADPAREDEAQFIRGVLLDEGIVKWHPFTHPVYGPIEIGGTRKEWGRIPPSFLLEEECHRNMAFSLYHAAQAPRLEWRDVSAAPIADGLIRLRATAANTRMMPTRTAQAIRHHIGPPDIASLAGPHLRVLSGGRVLDKYLGQMQPARRRPERLEIQTIPGLGEVVVEFIVSGRGPFTLTLDSAHGGVITHPGVLPP
ncbi:MAG TPA: M14 family metallopeptidase [Candidatus Paceibacterota bacterium]|nr:peptidase M14 [Verrucomicrobiota bacterium]HOX03258.1 M14 family metallopeptidase [Verrucomicrobiota bacterium]HRZ46178.1 M14 family metallopeptidase [Candidatus Paceibacterota bacterium]HRZ91661.1 M14 family metallopeptidase [Candidatus Paceibacterota bacterium]